MRGRDEETGEFHDKSRSQNRREALDVWPWAKAGVVDSGPAGAPADPGRPAAAYRRCKRITAHIAHKRQLAFLAKHMRREDEATLDAIRDALDANSETGRREVAMMHRVEDWRDRLLADGDKALAALLDDYPQADRQQLRAGTQRADRKGEEQAAAHREIFQVLRALMLPAALGLKTAGDEHAGDPVDGADED